MTSHDIVNTLDLDVCDKFSNFLKKNMVSILFPQKIPGTSKFEQQLTLNPPELLHFAASLATGGSLHTCQVFEVV